MMIDILFFFRETSLSQWPSGSVSTTKVFLPNRQRFESPLCSSKGRTGIRTADVLGEKLLMLRPYH